jgi:uncharacterized membrane protein
MKKIILLAISLFIILTPQLVRAENDFIINNFKSDITIQDNGQIMVEETVKVFFYQPKHGIYRDIPYVYQSPDGKKTYTEIIVDNVTDGIKNIPYEVTSNESNIRIRIGNPNKTVSGSQEYLIRYYASGVLRSFDDYDELYWNITGNDWSVPIEESSATIRLPQEGIVQSACYVGVYKATGSCLIDRINDKTIKFSSARRLLPGESLTIALGYEKGMVPILTVAPPKTFIETLYSPITLITFLSFLAVGIFIVLRIWWLKGRDYYYQRKSLHDPNQKEKVMPLGAYETIGAEYEPPLGLRPAEIGVIMDERADTLDVSATIVDLAVRGYLTIKEIPKKWIFGTTDYLLTKKEKSREELLDYEKKLLDELFFEKGEVKLSGLKNEFYKSLKKVKKELYKDISAKRLFNENPELIRKKYLLIAIVLTVFAFLGFFIAVSVLNSFLLGSSLGFVISGIFFMVISFFMPRKTALGRETYRKARGYKLFVSGTEKYRQPFFEKENVFMEVLPYAIVFGVTKKLADAMKEMGIKPPQPTWYVGAAAFNPYRFANNIDSFSHSLSSAIAAAPGGSGSGGGGFAGGGFGGGGGGSW